MVTIYKQNLPVFNDVKFLLKASSNDSIKKPVFQKVFIDTNENNETVLVCTDSMRLHIIKDSFEFFKDCENGLYDVIKNDAKEIVLNRYEKDDLQFPNYKQVIPEIVGSRLIEMPSKNISFFAGHIYKSFYNTFPSSMGIIVNTDFLHDAYIKGEVMTVKFVDTYDLWLNKIYNSPIVISCKHDALISVIMPVTLNV